MTAKQELTKRDQFLIELYRQASSHLDRHILVVWQSIGMLIGAVAILALVEKKVITIDLAATLIALICLWAAFHVSDASLWFNRNMLIINNVERQFLLASDLQDIHPYFAMHRDASMVSHFQIQLGIALGFGAVVIAYHFVTQVVPGFRLPFKSENLDLVRGLPYLVTIIGVVAWVRFQRRNAKKYKDLRDRAPGRALLSGEVDESSDAAG